MNFSPEEMTAILLTLRVATVATVASLPAAIFVAYVLARHDFLGKSFVNGLVHLPLVMPPVVTGYLLLITLGRRAPLGQFLDNCCGIVFSFRWTGAALAAAVMAFPLMVRAIRLSIEAIDPKFESAAATLGASPLVGFLTVTLPLSLPGIIAGTIVGFARALGEFGATITFVSNIPGETQLIATAIYSYTQVPGGDPAAIRLTIVAVVIAMAALIVSEFFASRISSRAQDL